MIEHAFSTEVYIKNYHTNLHARCKRRYLGEQLCRTRHRRRAAQAQRVSSAAQQRDDRLRTLCGVRLQ